MLAVLMASMPTYAQNTGNIKRSQLPVVYLPDNVSVQFISPEPIQYVDISVKGVIGDLPLKNVLRIRVKDSVNFADAVVTVAGEKFIAQYHVLPPDPVTEREICTAIAIEPSAMQPLDIAGIGFSQPQLRLMTFGIFGSKTDKPIEKAKALGLEATVYHLYTAGDYIFIDLGYRNNTNLPYEIEDLRFHIDDKKISKATNVQSIELKPEFTLFNSALFKKNYRNIVVLRKLSFPGNKVLRIDLSEKQISGRVITLNISYQDVLDADTVPNN